ncbi:hypothetical protein D0T84_06390, partial [Dysgonomonas sp. 521]|uniref:FISUMP domain-containing protein n=1 Tax=Dysgonomonas sp. 521 TaxID=2302932 RepID=UPI0013D896E0
VTPGKVGDNNYTITVNNCPTQTVTVNIKATVCTKITSATVSSCLPYMFTYQTMKLTAVKTGGSPATGYQWYVDGIALPGETNADFYYSPGTTGLTADALGNMKKTPKIKCDISNACGTVTSNEYEVTVVLATLGQLSPIYVNAWSEAATNANDFTDKTTGLVRTTYAHVNLGAEYELDPCEMLGDLYQWGRKKDGHQERYKTTVYTGPVDADDLGGVTDVNGQVVSGHGAYGLFITNSSANHDWRSNATYKDDLWGDGVSFPYLEQPYNPTWRHPANNPCPTGWKVPSQKQWSAMMAGGNNLAVSNSDLESGDGLANVWSWKRGYVVSNILYFPAAGMKWFTLNYELIQVGSTGVYWTSTIFTGFTKISYAVIMNNSRVNQGNLDREYGNSVRCIAE